ncbi:DUF4402 domain-containing protein [Salegentibacter sediminis]|uniref:DUF4402 domain-containing protein n=1 Tax=Salegentibacter sediminis TaxID=1930251 RepID=UPI0012FF833B|nr:DUF4402 domain-containing protein [Salegentibacter sediminis]
MKLIATLILFFIPLNFLGQASASFKASVTIVNPDSYTPPESIKISRVNSANSKVKRSTTRGVRINSADLEMGQAAFSNLASFQLEGESIRNLRINLPNEELILSNGTAQLKIKEFYSNRSIQEGLNKNQDILVLGAVILVKNEQEPGLYTSPGSVEIIVDYD